MSTDARIEIEYTRGYFNFIARHSSTPQQLILRLGAGGIFALRWLVGALRRDADERLLAQQGLALATRDWAKLRARA